MSEASDHSVEELVASHMALVEYQVTELARRLPSHIYRDDLASAGFEALVLAAQNYDPDSGVPFVSYASIRIRGALLDELRAVDSVSRTTRRRLRQIDEVSAKLAARTGQAPDRKMVAKALGVNVDDVQAVQAQSGNRLLSIHTDEGTELQVADESASPEDQLVEADERLCLQAAIACLPQRMRFIVQQTYLANVPLEQVAEHLGLTQSRVSQLRGDSLVLLRLGVEVASDTQVLEQLTATGVVARRKEEYAQAVVRKIALLRAEAGLPTSL